MKKQNYSPEEIADLLDQTNWSQSFSWDQVKRMTQFFQAYTADKGTTLFKQSSTENSLGILLKGKLLVVRDIEGQHNKLATLRAPHTFGELSLIDGQPRSAHILASTDAEFLLLTKANLDSMVEKYPLVAFRLLWRISYILSQRLRSTSGQLAEYLTVD